MAQEWHHRYLRPASGMGFWVAKDTSDSDALEFHKWLTDHGISVFGVWITSEAATVWHGFNITPQSYIDRAMALPGRWRELPVIKKHFEEK